LRDSVEGQKPVGGEAGGPVRKPLERGHEMASNEQHQKTEGGLHGDEGTHQAAP